MHDWLPEHHEDFDLTMLPAAAVAAGIKPAALRKALESPEVARRLDVQLQAGLDSGLTWAPKLYVKDKQTSKGKQVSGWAITPGLLETVLEERHDSKRFSNTKVLRSQSN